MAEAITQVDVRAQFERGVIPLLRQLGAMLEGLGSSAMDEAIRREVDHVRAHVGEALAASLAIAAGKVEEDHRRAPAVGQRRPAGEENPCESLRAGLLFVSGMAGRLATVPGLGGQRREVLIDIAERSAGMAKVVPTHLRTRLR